MGGGGQGRKGSGKNNTRSGGKKNSSNSKEADPAKASISRETAPVEVKKVGPPAGAKKLGPEATYEVVHTRVVIRSAAEMEASIRSVVKQSSKVTGTAYEVSGKPWLLLSAKTCEEHSVVPPGDAWMLIDGSSLGLDILLKKVGSEETAVIEATEKAEAAVPEKTEEVAPPEKVAEPAAKEEEAAAPEKAEEAAQPEKAAETASQEVEAAAPEKTEESAPPEKPAETATTEAPEVPEKVAEASAEGHSGLGFDFDDLPSPTHSPRDSVPAATGEAAAPEDVSADKAAEATPEVAAEPAAPEVEAKPDAPVADTGAPVADTGAADTGAADTVASSLSAGLEPVPANEPADSKADTQPIPEPTEDQMSVADTAVTDADHPLAEAVECLKQLHVDDISTVKSWSVPPPEAVLVCQAVVIMLGYESLTKELLLQRQREIAMLKQTGSTEEIRGNPGKWWSLFQQEVDAQKLLKDLVDFDKDKIPTQTIEAITPYIEREDFDPEAVKKVSIACLAMCLWVRAIYHHYTATKGVPPRPLAADGGTGGPVQEISEALWTACTPAAGLTAEAGKEEDFAGDYQWRSKDGTREGVLRLRPGGQWWHAAHRSNSSAASMTPEGMAATTAGMVETHHFKGKTKNGVKTWEMAESLGSWRITPITPGNNMLTLTCDYCRWSGEKPDGPSVLRPSRQKMLEMDDLVASGMVVFHYVPSVCAVSGHRRMDLRLEGNGQMPNAAKMLGLVRGYREVEPDDREETAASRSMTNPQATPDVCVVL